MLARVFKISIPVSLVAWYFFINTGKYPELEFIEQISGILFFPVLILMLVLDQYSLLTCKYSGWFGCSEYATGSNVIILAIFILWSFMFLYGVMYFLKKKNYIK